MFPELAVWAPRRGTGRHSAGIRLGFVADQLPTFKARAGYFAEQNAHLVANINNPDEPGVGGRHLLSPVNRQKLERILRRMLDESEFLSPYGRSEERRVGKEWRSRLAR